MKRVFLIVLDSFGIGEMPDADEYGDKGTNTLASVAKSPYSSMENMKKLEDIVKNSITGMIDVALINKLVPRIVKGLKDAGVRI